MNAKEVLILAVEAGELMLSSGAETYRVEDTMKRIMVACQMPYGDVFATTTGLFVSIEDAEHGPLTCVRRVKIRTHRLNRIVYVNEISRNLVEGKTTPAEALQALRKIDQLPSYSLPVRCFFAAVSCFSFCYIFGGQWPDCGAAFVIGLLVFFLYASLARHNVSHFLINIVCGAFISLVAVILLQFFSLNLDKVIIGSIMPLVPGVGLTNAVRDILEGDYLSGSSRILDAIMLAVGIATGVGTVLRIWLIYSGGVS